MPIHCVTVHPFDPWGSKIGGIENFIRAMFRCSPPDVIHSLIGVSEDTVANPLYQWKNADYEGTTIRFFPVMQDASPNQRPLIPLFLHFSWLLRKIKLPDEAYIAVFHRIEPTVFTKLNNLKSVMFIHGNPQEITGPHSEVKWKYVPKLYRMAENKSVSKIDHIHVVGQSGLNYMQLHYPGQFHKFRFQSTGYDERVFQCQNKMDAAYQKFNLNPSVKYILLAGRLEAQKNPLLALESFFQLRKTQKAHFIIAGEGSLKDSMLECCRHSTHGKDTHFLGRVDSRALAELMNICQVFLMTSHFEGMPIAALEALACGLPVISTDVGELRFLLKDGVNGKIVSQQNPVSIANALSFILNNPENYPRSICAEHVQAFRYTTVMNQLYQQLQSYIECS